MYVGPLAKDWGVSGCLGKGIGAYERTFGEGLGLGVTTGVPVGEPRGRGFGRLIGARCLQDV